MNKSKENKVICTKSQLAEILGVTVRSITDWQKEFPPLPIHQKAEGRRGNSYEVALCVRWFLNREIETAETLNLEQERAKLAKMQALKTEQAIKEKAGELLNRESVLRMWSGIISELRSKILNTDLTDEMKASLIDDLREIPVEKYAV